MSFQFPHSARLTPPISANAWKTLECGSLLGIWLAVVFCSECVPDVFFFFAILCQFVPRRGMDCVFYYDALKGCGALVLVVDWKWKPRPLELDSPSIHPSIHPSEARVCGGRRREGEGVGWRENVITFRVTEIWAIFARFSQLTAAPRDRLHRLCVALAGRCWDDQTVCFPQPSPGMWTGWRAPCCPCAPAPACLPARLPAWMAPCWSLKTPQCVSDQLQAVSPPHCRVINLIHHFAKITVFQQRAS